MTDSLDTLLRAERTIAVVRANTIPDAAQLAHALKRGGISLVELTFTTPGVEAHVSRVREGAPESIVGAGTVLDAGQARRAIDAGAQFLVTPCIAEEVAEVGAAAGIPVLMGALTPTEVMRAVALGSQHVKIFPAGTVGPKHIKDLLGPFPELSLVPSGGINETNAASFLAAGATAVCCGSSVVSAASVEAGDWDAIAAGATTFTSALA